MEEAKAIIGKKAAAILFSRVKTMSGYFCGLENDLVFV